MVSAGNNCALLFIAIKQAREQFAAGEIDAAALRQVEDVAIRDVVARQRDHLQAIFALSGDHIADGDIFNLAQRCRINFASGEPSRLVALRFFLRPGWCGSL
jgi:hypothetical protein